MSAQLRFVAETDDLLGTLDILESKVAKLRSSTELLRAIQRGICARSDSPSSAFSTFATARLSTIAPRPFKWVESTKKPGG